MEWFFIVLALLAGAGAPVQAGVNAQLRLWTKDPVVAAMISFAVGTVVLLIYMLLIRSPMPEVRKASELPWWIWTGGIFGAFLVAITIILAPIFGAATTMSLIVAGQLFGGMLLDHYGLLGFEEQNVSFLRICGAVLVTMGVILIKKF